MRWRGPLALAALAFVACGAASPPRAVPPPPAHPTTAPRPSAPPPAAEPKEKHVTFRYELKGRRFPIPLVRGTVAGTSTWMLVDTGASSHMMAGWLARQVGLPLKKLGDLGSDHAGRTIATFRIEHPKVVIEDWGPIADGPVLATEVPPLIEELGIGAFVSPQQLVEGDGGAVVLDFLAGEMRPSGFDDALHKLGHRGSSLAPNGGRVCEDNATPIVGLEFVLPASVEGKPVDLLVDTGAERTDLLATSPTGKALARKSVANKEELYAASGRMVSRTVKAATVRVGDYAVKTDVDLIPGVLDPTCPRDGVVSMDILRACVLVLGKTGMAARCGAR